MNKLKEELVASLRENREVASAVADRVAFSLPEVGELTSVSQTTVFALIREGKLRAVKLGRRTVVLGEDLQAFLASLKPVA